MCRSSYLGVLRAASLGYYLRTDRLYFEVLAPVLGVFRTNRASLTGLQLVVLIRNVLQGLNLMRQSFVRISHIFPLPRLPGPIAVDVVDLRLHVGYLVGLVDPLVR